MRGAASIAVGFVLGWLAACSGPGEGGVDGGRPLDFEAVAEPDRLGWTREGLEEVRAEVASLGAAAMLIVTSGETVLKYGDITRDYRVHSIRKSLLSALIGIAIAEGAIDPEATLGELGIEERTALTAEEESARVIDLLEARSGVYLPAASEVASMREGRPRRHAHPPGSHWYYNNWDFNALGTIYRQQTGEDLFAAFQRRIARPIGMQDHELSRMRYQFEEVSIHPSYKFRMSTRDLARFGMLFLQGGRWGGETVVPEEWVESSTRARSSTGRRGTKGGFGRMWWVYASESPHPLLIGPPAAFTASGSGGHRLSVLPTLDTVVVLRTDTDDRAAARIGSSRYDRLLETVLAARRIGVVQGASASDADLQR